MKKIIKIKNEHIDLKTVAAKLNELIDRVNMLKIEEKWWVEKIRHIREQQLEKIQELDMELKDKQDLSDTITLILDGAKYRIMYQAEGRVEIANEIMKCQDLLSRAPYNK